MADNNSDHNLCNSRRFNECPYFKNMLKRVLDQIFEHDWIKVADEYEKIMEGIDYWEIVEKPKSKDDKQYNSYSQWDTTIRTKKESQNE